MKISDALAAQGGEAASLAASQAVVEAHAKFTNLYTVKMSEMASKYGAGPSR